MTLSIQHYPFPPPGDPAPIERESYPAPLISSRDPWDGIGAPGPVAKLAQTAVEAGWRVRVQRASGRFPHATQGTPGAVKDSYAVKVAKPGWGGVAVYVDESWDFVWMWGSTLKHFGLGGQADFVQWLSQPDRPQSWYTAIRWRVVEQERRRKLRLGCNRGVHADEFVKPGLGPLRLLDCELCKHDWINGTEPWRKPKGKAEAL